MQAKLKSKLALSGGLLGLAAIGSLAVLLGANREPGEGLWEMAAVAVLATPYVVAVGSAYVGDPAARLPLLLAAAVVSLVFTFFLFVVGFAFLPATAVLFVGAGLTMLEARRTRAIGVLRPLAALMAAAAIVAAVPALYTHSDERCWETIRYPDGSEETRLTDRFGGGVVGLLGIPVETPRGTGTAVAGGCVSNVVTAREAVLSLIIASGGVVILLSVARLGHREGSAPR